MKKQILAIDDDSSIRWLLEYYLKNFYEVEAKKDGLDAMLWLDSGNMPDLIIADINMPRINGFEFLKNIKESGFYRDIPIIILSGFDNEEVQNQCKRAGVEYFMLKPFNPENLLKNIKGLLNGNNSFKYA